MPGKRRRLLRCRRQGRWTGAGADRIVGAVSDLQPGTAHSVQVGQLRFAYRTWGPQGATPAVLLHALGEQSSDWAAVAPALASSRRVYALDQRGHGTSDWTGPYTIEQLTADLAGFLDALNLDRVTLVGHSIGGPPAYLYAARHPGRVARLVLEDPAPPWPRALRSPVRPEGPLAFDWNVTALSIPVGHLVHAARPVEFTAALLARILGDPAGPATGDQDEAPGGHRDPHPGRLFAAAVALAADPALPELRGPLLQVLAGHLADLVARGQHDGSVRTDIDAGPAGWLLVAVLTTRRLRGDVLPAGGEQAVAELAARLLRPEPGGW